MWWSGAVRPLLRSYGAGGGRLAVASLNPRGRRLAQRTFPYRTAFGGVARRWPSAWAGELKASSPSRGLPACRGSCWVLHGVVVCRRLFQAGPLGSEWRRPRRGGGQEQQQQQQQEEEEEQQQYQPYQPAGSAPGESESEKWVQEENTGPVFSQFFDIDVVVTLLRQENARDICVIKVPEDMKYSDYFVIASGTSTRHLRAMAHYAIKTYKHLKKDDDPYVSIEGKDTEDWMCIDFGNSVVHLMLPETREVYELEKLWTLRLYDDQLAKMTPETLPADFIYGLDHEPRT
ncbi:mitochondrial assembly of ribosomal large subunit protein 1 [Latimeria chalumnae]|uniref:Mitochondrial assembly of ribosomal large subunit protein 1 n=1 Tax=Latimeria chalumnae TaxID=7897 RepID=H3AY78_LATCH|nr:PREDICTED: mitochondrial assembly of ribosomal large subunit protein 1 [Latimeria chalumnae]|eukprot:XP_005997159.1 PREDICTED: mitochondrial assembly of ribosomal large subunit protein 1 [Latimeria chalumnae]